VEGSIDRAEQEQEHGELGRVVAFSDGVFAIAITLLVLSLDVPPDLAPEQLDDYLVDSWGQVFAYFLSFAVIGRFWLGHHQHFDMLARSDRRLLAVNLVYLAFIVLIPFPTGVLGDFDLTTSSVVLYAAVVGTAALVGSLMGEYTVRQGLALPGEHAALRRLTSELWWVPVVFYLSIPVAFLSPHAGALTWLLLTADGLRQRLLRR
jgi:uncharacterized membrane protein